MEPISFDKFTLSNGLDVILHQDNSLPLAAVNIWYHVGSKDEQPGKTGYAHLFEHLMFEGSKHHNSSHFDPILQVGGTLNGSTTLDRTNYWENLPSNYLELALWLEADRMGFLLDALDQERLDIQRDVVKNERRQSYENRPYGVASIRLQEALYPLPHPYHWPTIGFHEDLDIATLDDARSFFQRFYTPNNASLTIAGDIQPEETREMVERYFGDLPSGPAIPRARRADSSLQGHANLTLHDRVLLPRLYLIWPTVPRFHPDEAPLSILGSILSGGKSSRMYRSLVYESRIAQSVGAHHGASEIAGEFEMEVTAAAGHSDAEIELAARAEIERILNQPPTDEEITRAKNRIEWRDVRMMASIGGFGGRANRLNSFNVFAGDPDMINKDLERFLAVRPEDVMRVANAYLGDRHVQMVVLPEPSLSHSEKSIDRSVQPSPAESRSFSPPSPQRHRLANGLEVMVLEKRGLPAVAFGLILKTGATRDPVTLPGLASLTTSMLQEGTTTRSSSQIAEEFEFMGSQLASATGRERTVLNAETLSRHWPNALEIIADLVRNPTFPESELSRIRTERLTAQRRIRDDPAALAGRVTSPLLYGSETPYGHPQSGTEDSLQAISRDDLVSHLRGSFGPESATLVVVGDVSLEEAVKHAEERLAGWQNANTVAVNADVAQDSPSADSAKMYLLDKPGAAQSVIRAGFLSVPRSHPDYYALVLLNQVFGGQFTARLNMNLRQDKGYSYGYRSWFEWHRRSSLVLAGGGVETNVTREAVQETLREFNDIRSDRPVTEEEFETAKAALLRQLPASFETPWQALDQLAQVVSFDLPDDYFRSFTANIEGVSLDDVRRAAQEHMLSDRLTLIVVGDREVIEPGLREIGLPIHAVDHDGREV